MKSARAERGGGEWAAGGGTSSAARTAHPT